MFVACRSLTKKRVRGMTAQTLNFFLFNHEPTCQPFSPSHFGFKCSNRLQRLTLSSLEASESSENQRQWVLRSSLSASFPWAGLLAPYLRAPVSLHSVFIHCVATCSLSVLWLLPIASPVSLPILPKKNTPQICFCFISFLYCRVNINSKYVISKYPHNVRNVH